MKIIISRIHTTVIHNTIAKPRPKLVTNPNAVFTIPQFYFRTRKTIFQEYLHIIGRSEKQGFDIVIILRVVYPFGIRLAPTPRHTDGWTHKHK